MKNPSGSVKVDTVLLDLGNLTIWFSYYTPIAFQVAGQPRVISENVWGNGTGVHLNGIDRDKSKRVKNDEFVQRLGAVVELYDHSLDMWKGKL